MATSNLIKVSEAVDNNRFSAEFFDRRYVFEPKHRADWMPLGRLLRKCEYGLSIAMNDQGIGYPIFRMNEIDGCFAQRPAKFAKLTSAVFQQYRLQPNDVLFNRTNSFEFVGRTGIVKDQTDCTFASYLIRLVPDAEQLLPEFLTVYLNTTFGVGQVKRRAMRSINQAKVSGSEIRKVLPPKPSIAEQRVIADLLNSSHKALAEGKRIYKEACEMFERCLRLQEMPTIETAGVGGRVSTVNLPDIFAANRIDAQCFMEEGLAYVDWIRRNGNSELLRDVIENPIKGRQQSESPFGAQPYCSIRHVSGREIVTDARCRPDKSIPLAKTLDLLLAITGATIGKIGLVNRNERLAFSGDMLCLRARDSIDPHYLLLALDHKIGQFQFVRWITGSTNGHLSPDDVKRVVIPRLSCDEEAAVSQMVLSALARRQGSERLVEAAKQHVGSLIEEMIER